MGKFRNSEYYRTRIRVWFLLVQWPPGPRASFSMKTLLRPSMNRCFVDISVLDKRKIWRWLFVPSLLASICDFRKNRLWNISQFVQFVYRFASKYHIEIWKSFNRNLFCQSPAISKSGTLVLEISTSTSMEPMSMNIFLIWFGILLTGSLMKNYRHLKTEAQIAAFFCNCRQGCHLMR